MNAVSLTNDVARIGLGLAALGRPGYINLGHGDDLSHDYAVDSMRAHAWRVLDAAYQHGVRYFDAARSYGRAEEFLGSWLVERRITDVEVASKWGYTYTADWYVTAGVHEVKDHTLWTLQRQWGESMAVLGPWLRVYQIHSATEASGVLDRAEVLAELVRLRDTTGVAIGLTVSGPDAHTTLERAIALESNGTCLFDVVQATWNILEPSLGALLALAHDAGMRVVVKEALANGRLTSRNVESSFTQTRDTLTRQAARLGCSLDQLALAAALAQPWADRVLSGAATIEQLESNLAAVSVALDDEARIALAELAEPVDLYWETRARLAWN